MRYTLAVTLHERRIYLSQYKRFAMITVVIRHTSENRVLPTLYRGGTWMDGTPLNYSENLAAKTRLTEIEELRKPAPRVVAADDDEPTDGWPFITW
jgi:hypothetical protein